MGALDEKVVVVTGGGRGIGRAIALHVGSEGGRVIVADTGVSLLGEDPVGRVAEEVASEIRSDGGNAMAFTEDIATIAGARAAVEKGRGAWDRFDGAVCCAGVLRHGPFTELTEEDFDLVIRTHLKGHFAMYQAGLKILAESGTRGSLVGITSGYISGDAYRAAYRAAKGGVVALTKSAALAAAPQGSRVNAIAPLANTRMTEASKLEFPSDPEDIAPLAVYLLSEDSANVNGEILSVAGCTLTSWTDPQPYRSARNPQRWRTDEVATAMSWLLERNVGSVPPPLPDSWSS